MHIDPGWIDTDGDRTGDLNWIHAELFECVHRDLHEHGINDTVVDERLAPVERR